MLQVKAFLASQTSLLSLHPLLGLGQTPGRPPSFSNKDTHPSSQDGRGFAVLSPTPQTSSKINALRTLVGGQAWTLAAQARRQWTPTTPHWPTPSGFLTGPRGVGKGHSHIPGGRAS